MKPNEWVYHALIFTSVLFAMSTTGICTETGHNLNGWSIENQAAIFRKNGKIIKTIALHDTTGKVGQKLVGDSASVIAGCLIVNRGIPRIEGTDMQGKPKSMELYTADGTSYKQTDRDSTELLGFTIQHPSGKWGVILLEGGGAEGDVSSFTLIRSNCSSEPHSLEKTLLYYGDESSPDPNDPSLTIHGMGDEERQGTKVQLIIRPDGTSSIISDPPSGQVAN